jgi:hypothetical protein
MEDLLYLAMVFFVMALTLGILEVHCASVSMVMNIDHGIKGIFI